MKQSFDKTHSEISNAQKNPSPILNPEDGYQRKWYAMTAVGTGVFLATVDGSIVNVSLPTMVTSLNTNFTVIQWVVLSYLLTVTTLMLGFGRLADIVGKKKIYASGFAVFTLASALCAFSSSVYLLIGFRIIQGIGAAMIMAIGPAIITESFPPAERGKAMGLIGAIVSTGIVIGPPMGGFIVDLLSWNWIFIVNIPAGICGTWMVLRFIPDRKPSQKQQFDYAGGILLFLSLISFLMGLSLGQQKGFTDVPVLVLLISSLILFIAFLYSQLRIKQPMIDLRLFKNPLLCVNLFTGFISFVAIGGIFILIPFYLEVILGFTTMKTGLFMCVIPVMMGIFSPISGALSDRFGSRPMTILGLAVLCFGYFASGTLNTDTDGIGYVLRVLWIGVGTGLFISPNNSAIMGSGPKHQLGIVSGLMAISRTMGQTVGVSLIGALWAIRIRTLTGNWNLSDVTKAPVSAQIQSLQFIFTIVSIMIFVGLCISVYGSTLKRKS